MSSIFRRLFGTKSNLSMADATQKVQQLIAENNLIVFSKSYCPYCASTKSLFRSLDAQAAVYELDQIDDGSALQDALEQINGQRTVPNVYIGQKHIGGNSEVQALNKSGELKPLLKSAGVLA